MEKGEQREALGPTYAASSCSPKEETNCVRRETHTLGYVDEKRRRGGDDRFKMGKYNGASSSVTGVLNIGSSAIG